MTAPTRTRRKPAVEPRSRVGTMPREAERPTRTGQQRTAAAERAYARRAQRADLVRGKEKEVEQPQPRKFTLRWPRSRASFVLIVMTLLAAGVATTLLLSTQAIADSYRLEQLREENSSLAEQSEQLQQDVSNAEAASSLADHAKALGMVPSGEPAHLVQNPDGSVRVVGTPAKATAPATPPPPAPSTPATPPATPAAPPQQQQATQPPAQQQGTSAPIEGDVPQGEEQAPIVMDQTGGQ